MKIIEAQLILEELGLPSNSETIRRWIRSGELPATKESRNTGYYFEESDFQRIVEKKLKQKLDREIVYQKGYVKGFEDAKKLYYKGE